MQRNRLRLLKSFVSVADLAFADVVALSLVLSAADWILFRIIIIMQENLV